MIEVSLVEDKKAIEVFKHEMKSKREVSNTKTIQGEFLANLQEKNVKQMLEYILK